MNGHETAGPMGTGRSDCTPIVGIPGASDNPTITIPRSQLQRVGVLLGFAFAATWTAADDGDVTDWSTQGEPLAEAFSIVRGLVR